MGSVRVRRMLLWWAVYVVAVLAGRHFVLPESRLALFWPAAGVAALWLAPLRGVAQRVVGSTLLFSTVAVVIAVELQPAVALWWAAANLLQALVLSDLLRRRPGLGPDGLTSLEQLAPTNAREVSGLAAIALGTAALGAVLGTAGALESGTPWSWWIPVSWVIRNGTGMFVGVALVSCLLVVRRATAGRPSGWTGRLGSFPRRRVLPELALATTVAGGATAAIFGAAGHYPVAFLVIPTTVWLGLRFAPGVAVAGTCLQAALVIGFSIEGRGPFGNEPDLAIRATTVQLFVLLCCSLALLLSVSVAERQALLQRAVRSEAEARERADVVSAVTRVMHEGLLVVDGTGDVVMSNPAAQRMLGEQAERLHITESSDADGSRNLDGSVMAPDERPTLRALRGEVVDKLDLARVDPATGAASVLSVSAVPMDDATGRRLAVLVVSDVTEDRARLAELKGFAGVMAHDLKGPVAGIRGWAEILDDQLDDFGPDAEAARATLMRMQVSAERAQGLIDDLLVYAQAGTGELHLERTSLSAVWSQALGQLPPPDGDGREIRYAEGDDEVEVDVVLVRQLLVNLVGNALKYVAPGVVPRVHLSTRVVDDRLRVEVRDNGIGIPEAEQGRVFEGFVRSSRTGSYPGTGLGLAICARAVQRHGGVIGARDAGPEGGTRITFTLPRPAAVRGGVPTPEEPADAADAADAPGAAVLPA